MFKVVQIVVCLAVIALACAEQLASLNKYSVSDVSVSGLSAGAYMAVQMHVAFSGTINGSAIFAGGPFYCAEGNLAYAENKCMKTYMGLPNVNNLVVLTNNDYRDGFIDNPANLHDDRVYVFSGEDDSVVDPKVVHSLETYYQAYVQTSNIVADFAVQAEHCFPTLDFGESCATLSSPYIGKCNFDGAKSALSTIYGSLNARTTAKAANLMSFSQKPYFTDSKASIDDTGYIY
eukprot:gene31092-37575_t